MCRWDTYLQDNKPAELPYEQGGKRWYDTDKVLNYIWDDESSWVDYNLAGPQGPKGNDGNHIVLISLSLQLPVLTVILLGKVISGLTIALVRLESLDYSCQCWSYRSTRF